jgi:AraC-like DNA-binding protein
MNTKLNHIQNWLELARQANWSCGKLAKSIGVSTSTLRRHIRKHMGKSTKALLAEQRQCDALKKICDGASIKAAASSLGYKHPTNFSRAFKSRFGICPAAQSPTFNANQPLNALK